MGKAVDPKKRRKRPNAAAVAGVYTIYVNPQASKQNDPLGIQAKAHPILEDWYERDILKEKILEAVLAYAGQSLPEPEEKPVDRKTLEGYMRRIERLIKEIPAGAGSASAYQAVLIEEVEELNEDIEAFGESFLSFGTDPD